MVEDQLSGLAVVPRDGLRRADGDGARRALGEGDGRDGGDKRSSADDGGELHGDGVCVCVCVFGGDNYGI